jgi:hypothetical protein
VVTNLVTWVIRSRDGSWSNSVNVRVKRGQRYNLGRYTRSFGYIVVHIVVRNYSTGVIVFRGTY